MLNKISSRVLSVCVGLIFLFIGGYVSAQSTSTSPFSSYGIGQRDGLEHATFLGVGATSVSFLDSSVLNFSNPASYNLLAKGQPVFSVGISSRLSFYGDGTNHSFSKNFLLNHYAMGFSFAKHFGLAFGVHPFSRRGYDITDKQLLQTDTVINRYLGYGNTSEAFLGLSANLLKLKKVQLAVGGNLGYVFGTMTNERRSYLAGSQIGGVDQNILTIQSFHYELGMYYKQKINRNNHVTLSAVVEPQQNFSGVQRWIFFTTSSVDNSHYYVPIDSSGAIKGKVIMPPSTTVGLNYTHAFSFAKSERQTMHSEIGVFASYSTTTWSDFQMNFGSTVNQGYLNTTKLTAGIQYVPEVAFMAQSSKWAFLQTIRYRAGYYHYSLPYTVNGVAVKDKAITWGIGLPVKGQRSLSSFNIGMAYGNRSNGVHGSLSENYLSVNVGVIFAPAIFERWFVKRKYD